MKSKILFPLILLVTTLILFVFFLLNPSYEKSIKSKYHYEMGDYKEAYVLANEAFNIDVYNRMASTIMAQSKTSLKYVKYNQSAKEYMKEINQIATHDIISNGDKAKIKMMSKIMIDSYIKLAPSIITDKDLVDTAATHYKNFEKLLEKVNK